MPIEKSFTEARTNFSSIMDEVIYNGESYIIQRRNGGEEVAVIAAHELRSLLETVHLLHSPINSTRLHAALARARQGTERAQSLEQLRREVGLGS
ncbi:MAG: type II toxin-antitoxin system Phd/YefM family antitoxin [Candidatus Viridilinea halotolerans]|uniref:Antitoxin n=1 Tax=Candidatus Viridilinea halotolerans TaxID=2491704 RepID=A0A426U3Q7_9CHLR|nr:MAG: type II toxin-antitoxin system Phd/YefM family antitoxin [Candidatus Viridilinea halotolerans]